MMHFEDIAREWDTMERMDRAKTITTALRTFIGENHGEKAMDFGCGTGLIGFELEDMFEELWMVDASSAMIDQVVQKKLDKQAFHIKPKKIDLLEDSEELGHGSFDVIFSSMVMHHVLELDEMFQTFGNLLRSGGLLLLVDLYPEDGTFHEAFKDFDGHFGFDPGSLGRQIEQCDFVQVGHKKIFQGEKQRLDGSILNYELFLLEMKKR